MAQALCLLGRDSHLDLGLVAWEEKRPDESGRSRHECLRHATGPLAGIKRRERLFAIGYVPGNIGQLDCVRRSERAGLVHCDENVL